jgi:hypothetical protein
MVRQVYGKEALGHSDVYKWHKHFAQGRDNFEDGRLTSELRTVRTELRIQEITTFLSANCSKRVVEGAAAAAVGISHGTCKILSDNLNTSMSPSTVFSVL